MSRLTLPALVVVMGIAGVGKSAVGRAVADRFAVDYVDGDDFHVPSSVAKMAAGTPLTDEDRWPWLASIGAWLTAHERTGGVVSCSALKRAYRGILTEAAPRLVYLHLVGDHDLILSRMRARDHFMPPSLLESQERTLEPLQDDENGEVVDVTPPPDRIVDEFSGRVETVRWDPTTSDEPGA